MGRVALCLTVLNEQDSIDSLFTSVASQVRQPDEILVVDGGSTDETTSRIERWRASGLPIQVIRNSGANISAGRNQAIAAATAEIIAVTDGGVVLRADWLACLVAPFFGPAPPDVVSGFFVSDPRTPFELALGATTLPTADEIDPDRFLPSSRSIAFLRSAWERIGGYPEWLDYCEDLVFDFALLRSGYRFAWAPDAIVEFRPRSSLLAFFKQYYRYARGDGKADLWRRRHAIRYATYSLAPMTLLAASRLPPMARLGMLGFVGLAALGYLRRPYQRLWPHLSALGARDRATALLAVPLVRLTGDIAKMLGYPVGVRWRKRRRGNTVTFNQ